ncbi:uncharacterized protein [Kogia breviceps]|uniref:uncharacterized protein n=1 Tax=Kogia breviceps TaxID=27615 RepID=UPI0034D2F6A5
MASPAPDSCSSAASPTGGKRCDTKTASAGHLSLGWFILSMNPAHLGGGSWGGWGGGVRARPCPPPLGSAPHCTAATRSVATERKGEQGRGPSLPGDRAGHPPRGLERGRPSLHGWGRGVFQKPAKSPTHQGFPSRPGLPPERHGLHNLSVTKNGNVKWTIEGRDGMFYLRQSNVSESPQVQDPDLGESTAVTHRDDGEVSVVLCWQNLLETCPLELTRTPSSRMLGKALHVEASHRDTPL